MPGGRRLPRHAPLLLTLAFLLPATTGAIPVTDEAPWGVWLTERVTDEPASEFDKNAIGLKPNGDPVVAYRTVNPVTSETTVALAERINGKWSRTFPSYDSHSPDLVVGADGTVHLTHREGSDIASTHLAYSTRVAGVWNTEVVHSGAIQGSYAPIDLDPNGYPHIVYATANAGQWSATIHHAYKDANGWNYEIVAEEGSVSPRSDLAVDKQGRVHISYTGLIGPSTINTHHALRNSDGTWTITNLPNCATDPTIDTGPTGTPHVGCRDDTGLVYYTQVNAQWVREIVDTGCGGDVILCRPSYGAGYEPSLQVDDQGRPHIVYRYIKVLGVSGAAIQTHPLYATKVNGEWQTETIDRDGWSHGYQPDIELDGDGVPHVVFVTGYEGAAAGTKGVNRAVYATPLVPLASGLLE